MKYLFEAVERFRGFGTFRRKVSRVEKRRYPVFPHYAEVLENRCLLSAVLIADAGSEHHDEPPTIAEGESQIIIGPHHTTDAGHDNNTHFFAETGDAHHFAWQDQVLSTPDVIDINYDYRDLGGRWGANLITPGQIAMAELALDKWEVATAGKIQFIHNTDAPKAAIIIIGTVDIRALGFPSRPGGILGLGGGTYTHNSDHTITSGIAVMDSAETWDEVNGNGNPPGTFDYFTVAAQEIGHALGLGHVDDLGGTNIMNGSYTGEVAAYSTNDFEHIQAVYGVGGPVSTAPSVSITSPTDGATVSGVVTITADATDNVGIAQVEFFVNGSSIGVDDDGTNGWSVDWDTTLVSDGGYTIGATATDTDGETASDSISVTVGTPTVATAVSVDSINYATEGGKDGNRNLLITLALLDDLGDPTGGASVSITLTNTTLGQSWSGTGTTGTSGTLTFKLRKAPAGTYTTVVTNVSADSLDWDGITPPNGFTKEASSRLRRSSAEPGETNSDAPTDSSDSIPFFFRTDTSDRTDLDPVSDGTASQDVVLSVFTSADWNPEETDETTQDDATEDSEPVAGNSQDLDELFTGLPSDELLVDVI